MKRLHIGLIIAIFVILGFFIINRSSKETYVLPTFLEGTDTSNICPEGFMLICVSSNLQGISQTTSFPESLPPPCSISNFPSFPLCLPQQRNMRPPSMEYRKKL